MVFSEVIFVCEATDDNGTTLCGNVGVECKEDLDECSNGHYPCLHRGQCHNSFGSYSCTCLEGWKNGPRQHCELQTNPDINFRKCMPGWKGEWCSDKCITDNDCKASEVCIQHGRGKICACRPGWTGSVDNCIDIDECLSSPCQSFEVCTNTDGSYSCGCPTGYTGIACSDDIDECLTNHCSYSGICMNTVGSYKCNCLPGKEGDSCQNRDEGFAPPKTAIFALAVGSFAFSIVSIIVVVVSRYLCKDRHVNQQEEDMESDPSAKSDWEKNTYGKNTHPPGEPKRNVVRIVSRMARISAMESITTNRSEENFNPFQNDKPAKHNRVRVLELENIASKAKRSCESQLLFTTDDIARSVNLGHQVNMAVLDFSKAFDKVSHQRLSVKMQYYGIRNETNLWINEFLNGRYQRVVVDGESSRPSLVTSGVPQGTVLGPALFLV
ncbi:delta-like protein B [Ruditapes philippinarum]|uniref:delta-like protein B n=1 Tax=Ruditapes philippinarum TaxID=129788 RepID=UPI00295BDD31|nr:delta-like protein B [Ruditapes philippinarum]